MKHNILFVLLLCTVRCIAQVDSLLSPEQLKEDVDYYFKMLHSKHPNPYYYYSLNEFESKKNKIYLQINKPLTHEQFAWIIGKMNSCLDMHSMIDIHTGGHWRTSLLTALNDKSFRIFPAVKIKNDRLYLQVNNLEIININGIKVAEILQDLKKYFNWKLPYEINIHGMESCFSNFLMNKYHLKAPFDVMLGKSDNIQKLEGTTLIEFAKESIGGTRGVMYGFTYKVYPKSSIAIFNMNDFSERNKDRLERKLRTFFKEVNSLNIQHIFYDLSMNGGGHPNLKPLDIIEHDSIYFKLNAIGTTIGTAMFFPKYATIQFNRKYELNEVVLPPNKDSSITKGRKLYVLQGINTASGADYFCRIVAENNLGILVGQNTGEPTVAFSYKSEHKMPNSGITFGVATIFCDFSNFFKKETLHPNIYWDVDNHKEFTETELLDIIKHCKKKK